ncbi:hypothetical protein MMC22_010134 [Lobaria immixta]|nr:hypothetical protein [Lobaria immixta]
MASDSKHDYTFKKLTGSANYKQWTLGTASPPPALVPKENDTEERSERIYQRTLKIKDHTDDVRCTVAKIGRMCTETVQKEFLALKPLTTWTPKDLWDHLKTRYTLQNWTSKWSTLGKLHSIHQRDCKNVAEFISKIRDITSEISDLNITMDSAIIIHTLNSLDDHFKPYLAILSHDAREKDKTPTLDTLSEALEDEELRLANQDKVIANYIKKEKKPDSKAKKNSVSKDPNTNNSSNTNKAPDLCTRCQKTHVKGECWMDKMTCNGCGKVGHIKKFCKKKEEKDKKEESNATTPSEPSTKGFSCYRGLRKEENVLWQFSFVLKK